MKKVILFLSVLVILIVLTFGAKSCGSRSSKKVTAGSSIDTFIINAPSNLSATAVSPYQVNLAWLDNSNNEDGFEIERSTDAINYGVLTTTGVDVSSYADFGPFVLYSTYYYRVRAYNTIGDRSAYSNVSYELILPGAWVSASAGEAHSLALTNNGTIWSWGWNLYGQLGLNDYISVTITRPTQIGSAIDWSFIKASSYSSYAIKTRGTLWSWGANEYGQLGVGDTYDRFSPEQVGTESDWVTLAGGGYHVLAIKTSRTLWSWGFNNPGQLGLGDMINRYTPTQVGTDSEWRSVVAGFAYSLAIKSEPFSGTLWTWGVNSYGQLGLGDSNNFRSTPTQVGTESDWLIISAGIAHTIGIKTTGTLWGWGYNGSNGGWTLGLGNADNKDRCTPTQLGTDSNWIGVSAGGDRFDYGFTIARKTDSSLWSWGRNNYGQLGVGDTIVKKEPVQITFPDEMKNAWISITAGSLHSIGLSFYGDLWVWGAMNIAN